jgi:Fe-S cluster assembly protein SufD
LGFPNARDENWKHTNVTPIQETLFRQADEKASLKLTAKDLTSFTFGQPDWPRLVFVNGIYSSTLSAACGNQKNLMSLCEAINARPEKLKQHLAHYVDYERNVFAALNTAFIRDGAFVYIPDGMAFTEPIHLIFVSGVGEENVISQPRNLIVAGKNSRAAVIESYVSLGETSSLTNVVSEIVLEEGAELDYYKFLNESKNSFHMAATRVELGPKSSFSSASIGFGLRAGRNHLVAALGGAAGRCVLNGFYCVEEDRHLENSTVIDHAASHGTSRQLYKGILDGNGTAAFDGKVLVRQDSQKTDAEQTNKNLLLSDNATVYTKPQLEIYADDVKCTHGAAVGQLDEDQMFYLTSRGIGREHAAKILSYGFANEVIGQIKIEAVRREVEKLLFQKLGK